MFFTGRIVHYRAVACTRRINSAISKALRWRNLIPGAVRRFHSINESVNRIAGSALNSVFAYFTVLVKIDLIRSV